MSGRTLLAHLLERLHRGLPPGAPEREHVTLALYRGFPDARLADLTLPCALSFLR